jgi:Transposase DDE domain
VRQFLADKAMGNLAGIWLLVPELLRLGAWDLVCGWTGQSPRHVGPRLALQLIHEAALCRTGVRHRRALNQRIFELANGLPFLASDVAIHELLKVRTVADSLNLQVALGKIRRASGHFRGRLLAIDPHRVRSFSKRHMRLHRHDSRERPIKTAQTFFVLDADTGQPICFTTGTSARTAAAAAEELLKLASEIFNPEPGQVLVVADSEHFTVELLDKVKTETKFDLLVPMVNRPALRAQLRAVPTEVFQPRWAGYATAKLAYTPQDSHAGPFTQYIQRQGERPQDYIFNAFLATRDGNEVEELTGEFPKRWHVEEFFNAHQALGWNRAGTCNLNIRYGQMTMGLLAQAAIAQFRKRLAPPTTSWDAKHMATAYFDGLEGDVRVDGDTILVTYYNAPDAGRLREHYEGMPAKLRAEKIDPHVPWLYGFQIDYRFR